VKISGNLDGMKRRLPLLVLTGAGISAESGVPTFRGANGLWRSLRPEELASPEAFARDPGLVWEWYQSRRRAIAACLPNAAHNTLAEIESCFSRKEGDFLLVTQNVDGLHECAGSRNVLRLHGSIWELRCSACFRVEVSAKQFGGEVNALPPLCRFCGEPLRPGVVWFGEPLDPEVLASALVAAEQAETVLVIGTSSLVYPAAALPDIALRAGAHVVEINPEQTPLSPFVGEHLAGPAAIELPRWWEANRGNFS